MNKIVIEDRNGFFVAFWRRTYDYQKPGKYSFTRPLNSLIFVAGGKVGDNYADSRKLAAQRAIKFREKHTGIGDIKFKKMK